MKLTNCSFLYKCFHVTRNKKPLRLFGLFYLVPTLIVSHDCLALGIVSFKYGLPVSFVLFTIILIEVSKRMIKLNTSNAIYLVPIKVVFLSILYLLLVGTILIIVPTILDTYDIKEIIIEFFGRIPELVVAIILTSVFSLLPIIISMLYIFFKKKENDYSNEVID